MNPTDSIRLEDRVVAFASVENLAREGSLRDAAALLKECIQAGEPALIARLRLFCGTCHATHQRFIDALTEWEEALAVARNLGHERLIMAALNNIGSFYLGRGMFEQSLAYLQEAKMLVEDHPERFEKNDRYYPNGNIGIVLYQMGLREKARPYIEMAAQTPPDDPKSQYTRVGALGNLALYFVSADRFEEAQSTLEQMRAEMESYHLEPLLTGQFHAMMGQYLAGRGQRRQALTEFDAMMAFYRENELFDEDLDMVRCWVGLLEEEGDADRLERTIDGIMAMSGFPCGIIKDYLTRTQARTAAARGDFQKAYEKQEQYCLNREQYLGDNQQIVVHSILRLIDAQRSQARFRSMAHTDFLSGCLSRAGLEELAAPRMKSLRESGGVLSVLLYDIDHFKQYNDHHGHLEGDERLKALCAIIQDLLPAKDCLMSRFGGDEFVVMFFGWDAEKALEWAMGALQAVRSARIPHPHSGVKPYLTISIGGSTFRGGEIRDIKGCLDAADVALYTAKYQGRDRIVYEGETYV